MKHHLAQINIARMLAPLDSLVMTDFVANLDPINKLAEGYKGFIWRLKDDADNATSINVYDDSWLIVNMSVWESIEALSDFVYHSNHIEVFKRRKEWFNKMDAMHMALWYVEEGHNPTVKEAEERLTYLRDNKETPYAFTFKKRFSLDEALSFQH